MRFFSTKNKVVSVGFKDALFQGLSSDGGLFMPETIPHLGTDFFNSKLNYSECAVGMIHPFTKDDLTHSQLTDICESAFDFPIPIKELNDTDSVLELFHGPTLAFKDFAARFMAHTMSHFLENENKELTILVATSGDTGSAVANGFFNIDGIKVIILYPSNRVSTIQEKQLTTLGGNITALEIDGSFDDCQRMVKTAFQDTDLRSRLSLSSANSINVARLLPQTVYYAWAWKQYGKDIPVIFSVPSGNFGNLTAGLLANRMGIPVEKFIAATNANDTFSNFLNNGIIQNQDAIQTISNAMDVGIPSNLDRIQNLYYNDVNQVKTDISSWSFSDKATKDCIQNIRNEFEYLIDPHTAIGILGLNQYREKTNSKAKGITLSTAHPGKFLDVIEPIIKNKIPLPLSLKIAMKKEKNSIKMSKHFSELKDYLLST
ncbi:MAG: threonine synthase [Candidatus Marinimicrobia bacterium]|nr:threonine synthase [Candidatus Neomarinimicrobiota bacterium]